jgi:hypothetical protein
MKKPTLHTRILDFPYAVSLAGGRLDDIVEKSVGDRRDVIIDYRELRLLSPAVWVERNGLPCEKVVGEYIPHRLRCKNIHWVKCVGLYTHLETVPLDHEARSLRGVIYWRPPGEGAQFRFFHGSDEPATLVISTEQFTLEEHPGSSELIEMVRDWTPPPSFPACLVPLPRQVHARYGGDPVTFHMGRRTYHRRLFVGGLETQSYQRPRVDAVLNLAEDASLWERGDPVSPPDRWSCKGEGQRGMLLSEIQREAGWIIERLRGGQRVLVHCSAGLNRSVTIACAALILLEGLPAEAALERVREHHPWARPDSHHWLLLRWLAFQNLNEKIR